MKIAASTEAPNSPQIAVQSYEVQGNTTLKQETLNRVFEKHFGTNLQISDIVKAASALQMEYSQRGYPTVNVTLPPQQITNGVVKIQVTEGVVTEVVVKNNRWFSSNNIMSALPSLRTNAVLAGHVFQAEVDQANANMDRQIFPQLEPGAVPGTSALILDVKERMPLHGRIEFNNYSTPNSPDHRINANVSYDNLWQLEHSLGVQYGFSPGAYKKNQPVYSDNIFDSPKIANYSIFYRAPLGGTQSVQDKLEQNPTLFGYSEANRRFELPPSSGRPELSVYASRSTTEIATKGAPLRVVDTALLTIDRQIENLSETRDNSLGFRATLPHSSSVQFRGSWKFGADYKEHVGGSFPSDVFTTVATITNQNGFAEVRRDRTVIGSPADVQDYRYVPITAGWSGSFNDNFGVTAAGASVVFGTSGIFGDGNDFQRAGAPVGQNEFFLSRFQLSRDQKLFGRWKIVARAEAQAAEQSLVPLEQFGIGGTASVRGYREGELYGDDGFFSQFELRTPTWTRADYIERTMVPFGVTFSCFTDFGHIYLKDPRGRPVSQSLWGAGVGAMGTFGSHIDTNLSVSWALKDSPYRSAGAILALYSISARF